jgi:hypothetical protein
MLNISLSLQRMTTNTQMQMEGTEKFLLDDRMLWYPNWLPIILITSIVLVAAVRLLNPIIIGSLFKCLFMRPTSSTNFRESVNDQGKTSWLLLLNFLISSSILCSIFSSLETYKIPQHGILVIPLVFLMYPMTAMFISGVLSGEMKRIRENFQIYSMSLQLLGVLLIPMNLMLFLNIESASNFLFMLVVLIFLLYSIRIYRGTTYAIYNNVNWYYIILYLCGLEILPLLILFRYSEQLS